MKLNRLIFTTAILSAVTVQAQTTEKRNQLEFSAGYNFGYLKNLEFAPVAMYKYEGPVYKLNYTRTSKKENLFEVKLDYLSSELKTDKLSNLNSDYAKVGMGFSYLKQIYSKDKIAIHLGLQSQTNTSVYLNENYSIYDDQYYFTLHQEFGIAGRFSYQINDKQYISSKLTIPIVLLRVTDAQGRFFAPDNYQSVLWDFHYAYKLSYHFDIKVAYNFNYARLRVPSAYRELQHQINLGINYKF
ncbi:hypothetical protein HYN56_09985 [Flavobacterium crocinum]|uniref:DUF481 domain-containing protein n=1 Tax=Flavobacterium crocinum TaxID=2183896 RepID=A0A2S1YKE3_9FLAO|nr:hypothetical protein [Flavobacterium crocinum]AWK04540.1 hypothetical protein HYN56_09985 [Flavobacterium crocinum]